MNWLLRYLKYLKWLYPGMQVKRWISLLMGGVVLFSLGAVVIGVHLPLYPWVSHISVFWAVPLIIVGLIMVSVGLRKLNISLLSVVIPRKEDEIVEIVYTHRYLSRGPRFAAIGGGTGLHNLLRGLKRYTNNLTAVVTVADDGGSSGRFRRDLGIIPPGDIRNCLVALAEAEPLLEDLFQYRFTDGDELRGHAVGNIFLAAMTRVVGSFDKAVEELSKVLAIRGKVLPSALEPVVLVAQMADGSIIRGESSIPRAGKRLVELTLETRMSANPQAIRAIEEADYILIGPGSLYTSIIPNLLLDGISEAINLSRAKKIYICNIMTQPGETDGFTAQDHIRALLKYIDHIDYIILNRFVPVRLKKKYAEERAYPVEYDVLSLMKMGIRPVIRDMVDIRSEYAHHNPAMLAQVIMETVEITKKGTSGGI